MIKINLKLWETEDKIRIFEKNRCFDSEFVKLARSVYKLNDKRFKIKISKPLNFLKSDSIIDITSKLNFILEDMILKNPGQWIWSHNRWK